MACTRPSSKRQCCSCGLLLWLLLFCRQCHAAGSHQRLAQPKRHNVLLPNRHVAPILTHASDPKTNTTTASTNPIERPTSRRDDEYAGMIVCRVTVAYNMVHQDRPQQALCDIMYSERKRTSENVFDEHQGKDDTAVDDDDDDDGIQDKNVGWADEEQEQQQQLQHEGVPISSLPAWVLHEHSEALVAGNFYVEITGAILKSLPRELCPRGWKRRPITQIVLLPENNNSSDQSSIRVWNIFDTSKLRESWAMIKDRDHRTRRLAFLNRIDKTTTTSTTRITKSTTNRLTARRPRRLQQLFSPKNKTGTRTVWIVKVTTEDEKVSLSDNEIYDAVFDTQTFSAAMQYAKCSAGALQLVPAFHRTNDRVTEIVVPGKSADYTPITLFALLRTYIKQQYNNVQSLSELADHVMFCMPPGTSGDKYIGVSPLNAPYSFFNDTWCNKPSAIMHEWGHNLGLGHAQDGDATYGDATSMMGYSSSDTAGPYKCFNGRDMWELQWFTDRRITVIPPASDTKAMTTLTSNHSYPLQYQLAAFTDYDKLNAYDEKMENSTSLSFVVLLQILDMYVVYNRAETYNRETGDYRDMVTIVQAVGSDSYVLAALEADPHSLRKSTFVLRKDLVSCADGDDSSSSSSSSSNNNNNNNNNKVCSETGNLVIQACNRVDGTDTLPDYYTIAIGFSENPCHITTLRREQTFLQRLWAWLRHLAICMAVLLTILRLFQICHRQRRRRLVGGGAQDDANKTKQREEQQHEIENDNTESSCKDPNLVEVTTSNSSGSSITSQDGSDDTSEQLEQEIGTIQI